VASYTLSIDLVGFKLEQQMRRLQCEGRNERVKYLSSSKACLIIPSLNGGVGAKFLFLFETCAC